MAKIHDWHPAEEAPGTSEGAKTHLKADCVWRTDPDGTLVLRLVRADGQVLSVEISGPETHNLSEFLWSR